MMPELKSKRNLYRIRTVRSITQTVKPVVSKWFIDFEIDETENTSTSRKMKAPWQRYSLRLGGTALDRIINKLRRDHKAGDILLVITPASKHPNLYKLHVIQRHQQGHHLGMTTITRSELSHLKASKALQKYCIVFGSRYIDLETMLLQTETIKNLISKKCCRESTETMTSQINELNTSESHVSSAGDYIKDETVKALTFQNTFIQTDPELLKNIDISLSDIHTLIGIINCSLRPSIRDIERFFCVADKLNFSLVVRPLLLWKASPCVVRNQEKNIDHFLIESYLPGNCYLGSIALLENELLQTLDLYPKLLFNIHVIEDVYEITPLPKYFVNVLRKALGFLKLELLYDAIGELIFDLYKDFTFL